MRAVLIPPLDLGELSSVDGGGAAVLIVNPRMREEEDHHRREEWLRKFGG
jgi:hypothetical protein